MTPTIIDVLVQNACALYFATLNGEQSPNNKFLQEKIQNPRIGDLVFESSSICLKRQSSVGYLIHVADEWVAWTIEPGDEYEEPGGYNDKFYYIYALNGRYYKWNNCDFKRILERDIFSLRKSDEPRTEWAKALYEHLRTQAPGGPNL